METYQVNEKCLFVDIIKERRISSDLLWASREWKAASAYNMFKNFDPQKIKSTVLHSYKLNKILKKISNEQKVPIKELLKMVENIIDEISYNRKVPVLRWLGFFVAKILKKLLSAVYVNETKFLKIKSAMGNNPLLFIPSHRSYCDFIIMSYVCFHYEVDIPRIAAGMDFQSMAVIGQVLRDACAFFIRRSFIDDELYSAVFSQYVHTLVVYGDGPIEFFIEGTRSRTQKSLMPKYGFLTMTLKPFLTGLVPDITIIPVNLSYDRILEEILFAYELLGASKPKETTKGFIKALSILNENYGNVYIHFGEPISVKNYFSTKIDRSVHNFGSVEMQDITQNESKCIIKLAHEVIYKQRELTSLSGFNLIAAVLNDCLMRQSEPPHLSTLITEVQWLLSVFKDLVPKTVLTLESVTQDVVLYQLNLHKSLIHLSANEKIQLIKVHSVFSVSNLKNSKGYELSNNMLDIAIPILMLQFYVNPCSTFLIDLCFIALIINSKKSLVTDELLKDFKFFCSVFKFEFIYHKDFLCEDFCKALNQSKHFRIIQLANGNKLEMGNNEKLLSFCINFLNSYIPGYITVIEILLEAVGNVLSERQIFIKCQQKLESKFNNGFAVHPANFSLVCLSNALQSFVLMKAVHKIKVKCGYEYKACKEELEKLYSKLNEFDFSSQCIENLNQRFSIFVKSSF